MGLPDDEIVAPEHVPDDLVCAVCLGAFLEPVYPADSECQHIYCQQCILDTLQRVRPECPTCRRPIEASQLVPHRGARERVSQIVVFCLNRSSGCEWRGPLASREEHKSRCLAEDLRQCRDRLARCRQELVEGNKQNLQKDAQIHDMQETLTALNDAMRALRTSSETQLSEANAERAKQEDLIRDLRRRNASLEGQMGALEDINAKLRARNLKVEEELTCKMSARDLTSKGVQCDMRDLSSADAEVADMSNRDCNQSNPVGGVLEAARHGHLASVRAILQTSSPEEVNVKAKAEGMSALHLAAAAGHTETARLLLSSKKFTAANDHASANQRWSHTALHEAAVAGHEGVVSLLLDSHRFVATAARTSNDSTVLHLAAHCGHARVVGLLLKPHRLQDADVNAVQRNGSTALQLAAQQPDATVATLLLNCPRFHKASLADTRSQSTALHVAADRGHTAFMKTLLESRKFHTAAVNATHAFGYTALHVAVKQGRHRAAITLRDSSRFTAVTARCIEGKTAMDIARERSDEEMISLLLSWPGAPFMRRVACHTS